MRRHKFFISVVTFQLFAIFPVHQFLPQHGVVEAEDAVFQAVNNSQDFWILAWRRFNMRCAGHTCMHIPDHLCWAHVPPREIFGMDDELREAYWSASVRGPSMHLP